jgi:hypothetical protein
LSIRTVGDRLHVGRKPEPGGNLKYIFLVILDEKKFEALSGSDAQALDDDSIAYAESLQQGRHMVAGHALETTHSATTVRVRGGKASVTDGPFVETNEQVGGFLLVEARDLNEAILLASKMPAVHLGGIEIRPVRELTHSKDPKRRA